MSVIRADKGVFSGNALRIRGNNNLVSGNCPKVWGDGNIVSGNCPEVTGNDNNVSGNCPKVRGDRNTVRGNQPDVQGAGNVVNGKYPKVLGTENMINSWNHRTLVNAAGNEGKVGDRGGIYVQGVNINDLNIVQENSRGISRVTVTSSGSKKKQKKTVKIPTEAEAKSHDRDLPEDDEDEKSGCVICAERYAVSAAMPCAHKQFCCQCARKLGENKKRGQLKCPMCNKTVKSFVVIYE